MWYLLNGAILTLMSSLSVLGAIWLFVMQLFGLRLYKITNTAQINMILNKLDCVGESFIDDKPLGWIFGRWYIGYTSSMQSNIVGFGIPTGISSISLFTTAKFYENLIKMPEMKMPIMVVTFELKMYERVGRYEGFQYIPRTLKVPEYEPKPNQKYIMERTEETFREKSYATVYIHGEPGCGKSTIGLLLAKKLHGSFCDTFNPTEPGNTLSDLYKAVCPTMQNPLILMLEEYDVTISDIHRGIAPHKRVPTQIKNKRELNMFYDKINCGFFPCLIILMISNKNPEFIDKLDNSYLRLGRVDLRLHLE